MQLVTRKVADEGLGDKFGDIFSGLILQHNARLYVE